jgi:phage gpG-like protein
MKLTQTSDTLSPDLRSKARALRNPRPILEAMGLAAEQLTKRAFNEPGLRPSPWPAKKDGSVATLRKNQMLSRSPRVTSLNSSVVTIGSDRRYAAIHQMGGKTRPMPARPFFPFFGAAQKPTERLKVEIDRVVRARLAALMRK